MEHIHAGCQHDGKDMTTSNCCEKCLCDIKGSECNECHNWECSCHTQPAVYSQGGSSISIESPLKDDFDQPLPTKDWEKKITEEFVERIERVFPEEVTIIRARQEQQTLAQRDAEMVEMFERIQEARKKAGTIDDYILLEEVIARIKERNV